MSSHYLQGDTYLSTGRKMDRMNPKDSESISDLQRMNKDLPLFSTLRIPHWTGHVAVMGETKYV
jgi:hypothetical protein